MGDGLNTPVGEAILQGAQVFNQAVAIYLQDRRAQANFEARQKEADALNKMREQKFKMEQEVFELEKQKTAMEMERLRAETGRIEAITASIPTKLEYEGMRAQTGARRADIYEIKTRADVRNDSYRSQLKGAEAEWDKAVQSTTGTSLGASELREFEGYDLNFLQELAMEANKRLLSLQSKSDVLFPEQNKEQERVLSERLNKINKAYSVRRGQVLEKMGEYEKESAKRGIQAQTEWMIQNADMTAGLPTVTSQKDKENAAAVNNAVVKTPVQIRTENLVNLIDSKPDQTPGAFQDTDIAHMAKELVALSAEDPQATIKLITGLKNKMTQLDYQKLLEETEAERKVANLRVE